MEIASVISIVGGIITVITIIVKKCKMYMYRDSNGKWSMVKR